MCSVASSRDPRKVDNLYVLSPAGSRLIHPSGLGPVILTCRMNGTCAIRRNWGSSLKTRFRMPQRAGPSRNRSTSKPPLIRRLAVKKARKDVVQLADALRQVKHQIETGNLLQIRKSVAMRGNQLKTRTSMGGGRFSKCPSLNLLGQSPKANQSVIDKLVSRLSNGVQFQLLPRSLQPIRLAVI